MLQKSLTNNSFQLSASLEKCSSWKSKLDTVLNQLPMEALPLSRDHLSSTLTAVLNRFIALQNYDHTKLPPLRSSVVLLKPSMPVFKFTDEEYGLSSITDDKIQIHIIEGNHVTILSDTKIASILNDDPVENTDPIPTENATVTPITEPQTCKA